MDKRISENEVIKLGSNYLRGTLQKSMSDELTGALAPDDAQISKFHGFYQQDDRDVRQYRKSHYLEPYYSFMLRARLPGGVCTANQWQTLDSISKRLGNGSIRLTTRQTFQFHGILKHNLKPLIQDINQALIDSIGGCGDINRNVMFNPNPQQSELHQEVYQITRQVSEHLLPNSRAYHEIWLDGKKLEQEDQEPIYGEAYLPRKFKTAIAIPPDNDVDIYTNDLGFVAIAEQGKLIGFNVLAGGGMGTTHGDKTTFPRLADELGFISKDKILEVAEAVVSVQRDEGNRVSRRHARLKYTVEHLGVERFRQRVEKRANLKFKPAVKVKFDHQGDRFGWTQGTDKQWNLTLFVENGRVIDSPDRPIMTGLRKIALLHHGDFRITPSQNLIIAGVSESQKEEIEQIAVESGLINKKNSLVRLNSIACVALPTCPQAMAEAERTFPALISKIDSLLERYDLNKQSLVIRMTGCPNGCARPFVAEIGLVGKGPGRYNLFLGGDGHGQRLNKLYRENLNEKEILDTLSVLFKQYQAEHKKAETFGDFVIRQGIVKQVINPVEDFHD